jgi:hypothetical protein
MAYALLRSVCALFLTKHKPSNPAARDSHLIRYNVAMNVEGGSDVRVAHHLSLNSHGGTHCV